ncbi:MAG: hypothetical protein ACI9I0_001099 [Rhodoferax sp.]|jgi:hypothetical protein
MDRHGLRPRRDESSLCRLCEEERRSNPGSHGLPRFARRGEIEKITMTIHSPSISQGVPMNATRIFAVILIAAGAVALAYGSFSYTKDTTAVKVGPMELTVKEKETVTVPLWAGVGAIVVGGLLLVMGKKG